jgi:hypothetical protein
MKIAKSPEADTAHTNRAATSKTVNRMLGLDLASWNNIMVGAAALAAFAAVVSGVATYVVIRLQDTEASAAKKEFEQYRIEADKKTAQLSADAEASRAAIAGSIERAALADLKAADAIERARKSELELAKIQTPRTLTPEQQDIIVKFLASGPKGPVAIDVPFVDSTDAKPFARSIENALKKAGFEISSVPRSSGVNLSWDRPGAWMLVHDMTKPLPHAVALQTAFAAIGIYLEGMSRPDDVPPGMVVIAVSSHPLKSEPIPEALLKRIPKAQ